MHLKDKNRLLITAALPYANGRLHIGHIAGAYLPADIAVRYLRLAGKEAHFVCGSDENGAPITFSALKEGVDPQVIIDRYTAIIEEAFSGLNIDFSIYGRTHTPRHAKVAQDFFLQLHDHGYIVKKTTDQVYCTECERFLPDRYIEGRCHYPDCGAPGARGDQCEKCGRPIDATKLIDPECMVCKTLGRESRGHIEVRSTAHWYFRLDNFSDRLREYLDSHPEWRESVKRFSYGLIDQGLRERAITRDMEWGVPVPLPDGKGKVLYVWFDAPIGYITFSREHFEAQGNPDGWRDFWRNDENGLIHFIGKDNTVFHTVIFPGMLMAHGEYRLPDAVVVNEFLNLEGEKISTSRDYAVWVDEYLKSFKPDPLRYYLAAIAPESADADFSWKQFQRRNNGELADNLGNFIQRNLTFCNKYFDGKVPTIDEPTEAGGEMLAEIDVARRELAELLDDFRFKAALERLMKLSQRGNQYFAEEEPWKTRKTDMAACARTMHVGVKVVEALSVFMSPFMPAAAARLRGFLRLPALGKGDWNAPSRLSGGEALGETEVLFPKFDDAAIEPHIAALKEKLAGVQRGTGRHTVHGPEL
ncbi:MAG: methionine--tRNA ligase [Planctomycetota bacterium]|nr:methionine--tRNA ligase [Planctomycetota bacterium]